jgi:hypothetical protein
MQMANQPDDCDRERREKKKEDNPTFPSLFAKPARLSTAAVCIGRLSTFQRYRNVQPLLRLLPSRGALVAQRSRIVFR